MAISKFNKTQSQCPWILFSISVYKQKTLESHMFPDTEHASYTTVLLEFLMVT